VQDCEMLSQQAYCHVRAGTAVLQEPLARNPAREGTVSMQQESAEMLSAHPAHLLTAALTLAPSASAASCHHRSPAAQAAQPTNPPSYRRHGKQHTAGAVTCPGHRACC
jgi:hypothetical protein